jgi:twinkle protein
MEELPPLAVQPALSIGIPALDKHMKLRLGDFSVVTGIPSHGKSTFANTIAHNMAKIHGWNVCFASFEQPPQTEHKRALRTLHAGRPAHLLTEDERQKADAFIQEKFCFIVPNDDSNEWADMTWLKDRMVAAVTRFDSKLIVIDPWNELDHMYNQRETSMTQYVGTAIKDLKRFAKAYQVHVMVVAHPAKLAKDRDGFYPIPRAYDISDSAHWYNKPEQVIVVYRQENGNTLLRVAKSRYHYALGVPGDVELKFDDYTGQYKGATA